MYEELKYLDLTENETKIYLELLKKSPSKGSEIKRSTQVTNSRVYEGLDSLIAKGIVTYITTPKGRLFSAEDPSILKQIIEERKKRIESLIPQLKKLRKQEKKETETAVYDGFKGFRAALFGLVEECPKNEEILILGFSNQDYKSLKLRRLLSSVNKISLKKNHKLKVILDNKNNQFFSDRTKEAISEVRFMGKNFTNPAAIDIFKDKVHIFFWGENPFVFMIKNEKIADSFKTYFNFMWSIAKN